MEILIIITLVACVVSVIISVITLLTQKRLAENIGVNKITDEQTAKQLEMLAERTAQLSAKFDTAQANRVSGESVLTNRACEPCDKSRKHAYRYTKAELRRNSKAAVAV